MDEVGEFFSQVAHDERLQQLFRSCRVARRSQARDARNVADNRLGGFKALKKSIERGIVIAFRQAAISLAHHQRHVRILRIRQAEQTLQVALLGTRAQQVHAAHHAVHALLTIVDHHGELIRERLIASTNEKIAAIVREVLLEVTLNQIVYRDGFIGHNKPHRRLAHSRLFCTLLSSQSTACTRIHELFAMVRRRSRM